MEASDGSLILFSLGMAFVATSLVLPLGLWGGWLLARWEGRAKWALEAALTLPVVASPAAVGLLLVLLLGRHGMGRFLTDTLGLDVLFTWKAVLLADAVVALPFLVRGVRNALLGVDPALLGMARSLGATPLQAFRRVELPLCWRGILSGLLLGFCRAVGELGVTLLVAGNIPGRTQTVPLALFERADLGQGAQSAPLLVFMVVLAFAAVSLSSILNVRRIRKARPC